MRALAGTRDRPRHLGPRRPAAPRRPRLALPEPARYHLHHLGGPEIHTALANPIQPWKVEILDGILWEDGKPLDDWAKKLKETWSNLTAQAHFQGDAQQARAAHLASRAVRAILLYGIGSFTSGPAWSPAPPPHP